MFFQPAIGVGGYSGWLILQRTEANQREAFERSPALDRDIEYFRENISKATTAEKLVGDRRLLTVALGAFGLSEEIDKRAFIEKALDEGTEQDDAFANRLNDPRFKRMAETFGYGNVTEIIDVSTEEFREDIIARFKSLEFERAVGETDNDMRLALNFRREITEYGESEATENTMWFQIMGNQPLREVLAAALNIPSEVSQLDIDRQREIFADKANQIFGDTSPALFGEQENIDEALRRFFIKRQLDAGPSATTPGMAALTVLQSGAFGAGASANFFSSQI